MNDIAKPAPTLMERLRAPAFLNALKAVASKHVTPDRMQRLAILAVTKTPLLAQCTPTSIMGACMTSTVLGLEFNTPAQHAHLIPRKVRKRRRDRHGNFANDDNGRWIFDEHYEADYQVGYRGYGELMWRTGIVLDLAAEVWFEHDTGGLGVDYEIGSSGHFSWKPARGERGRKAGSFCYTRLILPSGREGGHTTVLYVEDIERARARSESFKYAAVNLENATTEKDKKRARETFDALPWVRDEDAMWRKTAVRRHINLMPFNPILQVAATIENAADRGTLDLDAIADVDAALALQNDSFVPERQAEDEGGTDAPQQQKTQIEHKTELPMAPIVVNAGEREKEPVAEKPAATAKKERKTVAKPDPAPREEPPPPESDERAEERPQQPQERAPDPAPQQREPSAGPHHMAGQVMSGPHIDKDGGEYELVADGQGGEMRRNITPMRQRELGPTQGEPARPSRAPAARRTGGMFTDLDN